MSPILQKAEFRVDENADFKGKIPDDVLRPIEKQDTATHVSASLKTKGVSVVGAQITVKGTF